MIKIKIFEEANLIFDKEAVTIKIKTLRGYMSVMEDYSPFIAILHNDLQTVVISNNSGTDELIEVKGGLLQVEKNEIILMTNGVN